MVDADFGHEYVKAYIVAHPNFIHESVARLGLCPRTAEEVHASPWP